MSGAFVNRGMTKIDERNDQSRQQIDVLWYTGSDMQNRDIRKFVEVIYRNFEQLEPIRKLNHNRTEIKKVLTSPTSLILVATKGERMMSYIIGDLVIYNGRLLFHIYYLFTSPGYRGRGIATFLLNQVHEHADTFDCSALSLTYDTYDKTLTKFYASNGFTYDPELRSHQRHDMMVKYI